MLFDFPREWLVSEALPFLNLIRDMSEFPPYFPQVGRTENLKPIGYQFLLNVYGSGTLISFKKRLVNPPTIYHIFSRVPLRYQAQTTTLIGHVKGALDFIIPKYLKLHYSN